MAPIHRPAFWSLLTQAAGTQALPDWATAERAITMHAVQAGGTVFLQGVQHPYVYAVQAGLFKLSYLQDCLLYTSPSPRDKRQSRMPSSA